MYAASLAASADGAAGFLLGVNAFKVAEIVNPAILTELESKQHDVPRRLGALMMDFPGESSGWV